MYANACFWRRIVAALIIAIALPYSTLTAAEVVTFDFDTDSAEFELLPESHLATVIISPWSLDIGSITDFTGNPGRAMAGRNFVDDNFFALSISPADGFELRPAALSFDHLASATGPQDWYVVADGITLATGATSTTFAPTTVDLSALGPVDILNLQIGGRGASSTSGTLRLDNVVLSGATAAVPIPPGAVLLPSALLLLGRRRA